MLTDFSNRTADLVAAAAPSVVQVQGRGRPASGVVYAEDVVVTTMRALGGEDGIRVRQHDGATLSAELAGWDPATGLAVLRASGLTAGPMQPATARARVGHLAIAVARSWSNALTASVGIVSVIGGPLPTGRKQAIDEIIRTTAPMHGGFAGGALVDSSAGLLGVATAMSIRGLGVVIPTAIAWTVAGQLLDPRQRRRGYLGIMGHPVTLPDHQSAAAEQRTAAVLVVGVAPGSSAALAGVLVGDIVLALDDHPTASPEDLLGLLSGERIGRAAMLHLLRGGARVDVSVTIGERPAR